MSIDIFLNQTSYELTDCSSWYIQIKTTKLKGIKSEGIIYQKVLLRAIISSWMEKHDQPIDSDKK